MKAEEKKFLQFLEWADKSFIIPVYQRNYDWKREQCKQLFDDIVQIVHEEYRTHFMWTIVAYNDDGYGNELLIIDWQQRLTTLSLLLLAIYKVLDEWEVKTKDVIKEKIYDEYLINKYSKDKSKKIRLKPIKDDKDAFNSIFEWDKKEDSNIVINYEYFYERIKNSEVYIDDLYRAIEQLIIVEIRLLKWVDDPQLIFESLNSTWLDLSEADKVRNYILMWQPTNEQERLYQNYWYKIEINTNYDVSRFLRDYLTFKERRIPNKTKVYIYFKSYIIKNNINIEDLLIELLKISYYYWIIINSNDDDREVSKVLKRINKLETDVSYPYLIDVYGKFSENIINKDDLLKILLTIESYVFRRFICNVPTNALNKTFMLLWKDIESHVEYKSNYLDVFNYVLINKEGVQRFPKDEEFSEYLKIRDIYWAQSRNKLHLLERLESHDHKESDIERLLEEGDLSIEHIMPQTLTYEWQKELGDNYKEIHENYLNTLSNLTLTGYNSRYSNKPFKVKKEMEKWFNSSPLYLNHFLKTLNTWGEKEMQERFEILKNKAQLTWLYPKTNFEVKKDETKMFTLSDEVVFTWERILEFTFEDNTYEVNSWATFYENIIKLLFDKDPILMKSFVHDEYLSTKFSKTEVNWYYYAKIGNELYLKMGLNTQRILYSLKQVFDKYQISLDDLTFYIK